MVVRIAYIWICWKWHDNKAKAQLNQDVPVARENKAQLNQDFAGSENWQAKKANAQLNRERIEERNKERNKERSKQERIKERYYKMTNERINERDQGINDRQAKKAKAQLNRERIKERNKQERKSNKQERIKERKKKRYHKRNSERTNERDQDINDKIPLDPTERDDTDNDAVVNNADTDDDTDGVADINDSIALDVSKSVDTDSDGIGNNADPDDDNKLDFWTSSGMGVSMLQYIYMQLNLRLYGVADIIDEDPDAGVHDEEDPDAGVHDPDVVVHEPDAPLRIPHDSIAEELWSKITLRNFFNSGISDADVALDWVFFADLSDLLRTNEVAREWHIAAVVFVAIGTLLWFFAATDLLAWRRVWWNRNKVPVDSFTRPGVILILNIILEDIPQIIISLVVTFRFPSKVPRSVLANIVTSVYAICNKLVEVRDDYGTRASIPQLVRVHTLLPNMSKEENRQRNTTATDLELLAKLAAQVGRSRSDREHSLPIIRVPEDGWNSFLFNAMKAGDPSFFHGFDLTKAALTDAQMNELCVALEFNKSIRYLRKDGNPINAALTPIQMNELFVALADNTSIEYLHLDGNRINEDNARQLRVSLLRNTSMIGLSLANTMMGMGNAHISVVIVYRDLLCNPSIRNIRRVDLSHNQLGDDGAELMASVLNNTTIKTFSLNNNGIGDAGAIALARAIERTNVSDLLYLNLVDNPSITEGRARLLTAMQEKVHGGTVTFDRTEIKQKEYTPPTGSVQDHLPR
jgi:hypothetical protein